jgi:hypothetical protein
LAEEIEMKACRSCGSRDLEKVLDLGEQPWGNDFKKIKSELSVETYPLRLFFCQTCSMVQIDHTVPKEKMFVEHSYMSGTTKSLKRHFEEVGRLISNRYEIEGKYILDIGGNDGTFLEFFQKEDVKILNVESGDAQAKASQAKGINTAHRFFNFHSAGDIKNQYGPMRVIHGSGVLFHLEELHSAFKGIELLLDDKGVLVAEFIYLPTMIMNCAYDQIYHEHLLYYSLHSLQRLLSQFDMEIFDASLVEIHGGSCIAHICKKGMRKSSMALAGLLKQEKTVGIDRIDIYKKFATNSEKQRSIMNQIISDLKSSGKNIQALGAPVKGSTIINFCNLNENQIDCAVEINPYKFGTYIPGSKIPVLNESEVDKPDVYLLLAWNFANEILPRFASFRELGGQFIIPIPTPTLI